MAHSSVRLWIIQSEAMHNVTAYWLLQYYQSQQVPLTWYVWHKLAHMKIEWNFWLILVYLCSHKYNCPCRICNIIKAYVYLLQPLQGMRLMPGKESSAPEEQSNLPQLLNTDPPSVNLPPPEPVTTSSIYPPVPVSAHDVNVIQDSWSEQTVRILASSNDDTAFIMAPTVCSGY